MSTSAFDAVRRRKQGEDAKKRVLSRVSSDDSSTESSMFDSVRNRKLDQPTTTDSTTITPTSEVLAKTGGMIDMNPLNSTLSRAISGDPTAVQTYKQATGVDLDKTKQESQNTRYNRNKEAYESGNAPAIVKAYANVMNNLLEGNPVGRFLSSALPSDPSIKQDSTGNKTADNVASFLKSYVTQVLTPTGAPIGQGTIAAPYQATERLANTSLGQKVINSAAADLLNRGLIPKGSQAIAQNVAKVGFTEGIAGIGQNVGFGLQNGQDSAKEITQNAQLGLAGGLMIGSGGAIAREALPGLLGRSASNAAETAATTETITPEPKATTTVRTQSVKKTELPVSSTPKTSVQADNIVRTPREKAIEAKVEAGGQLTQDEIEYLNQLGNERGGAGRNAVEEPTTTVNAPEETVRQSAEPMKQDALSALFGDQGVGIVAGGSTKTGKIVDTSDQIVSKAIKNDKEGYKQSIAAQGRATYQNMVDSLSPLKKVGEDVYETAMDAQRSNQLANTIVRDKFVNMEGQVVGESLKDIFQKIARGKDKEFLDYLNLQRAADRMEKGQKVYDDSLQMTPEKAREKAALLEKRNPGFAEISQDYYNFWKNVRQLGVDEGLITQEAKDAMEAAEPHYVPQRRQFKRSEKPGQKFLAKTTKSSFSGQKAPIQKLNPNGSGRDIIDARKTTTEAIGSWTNAILRNRTMQSIVKAVESDPERFRGIIEFADMTDNARQSSLKEINELIQNEGIEGMLETLDKDFDLLFNKSKELMNKSDQNVVRAMVDGKPVYMKVNDPEVMKALLGMGPQASNVVIDVLSAFSNATKRGATGSLAPVYAVKSLTNDFIQSAIQSKNPPKQIAYTVYGILSGIGDSLNIPGLRNWAQEYRRAGGGYSSLLRGEKQLNKSVSDMSRVPILSPRGIVKGVKKTVTAPLNLLEEIGNITENAPRIAASKIERQSLGNEITPENIRKAMSAGREATVNFSRKGSLSRDIEAFVPYNNSAVQGTYRILKAMKENPVRTGAAILGLSVMPKLYEYSQFADDPDYQNLSERDRMRYWIVNKNADGTFTRIPMDPAYNSFGEATILALRAFKDNDPTAFKGFADAIANAWTPPLVTGALQGVTQGTGLEGSIAGAVNATVAAPFVATTANQSYTGAPIVSQSLQDRSKPYQYDEKTSSVAKAIGQYLNASPQNVDYIIKAYGGDAARLLLPLTSDVGKGNVRNTLLKNFIVDPAFSNTLTDDFYDAKDKLNQAYADNREAGAELPSWYSDEMRKQLNSTAKGSISKQLSDLRAYKKEVTADKSLSNKARTDKLRDIQQQINEIYINVNSSLQKAGVIK